MTRRAIAWILLGLVSSRWKLRAAAAPEQFLTRGGFVRFLSEGGALRRPRAVVRTDLGVVVPPDLARFLDALGGGTLADFSARPRLSDVASLVRAAKRGGAALVRLTALLAGAVPFGETRAGEIVVYVLEDPPARDLVAALEIRGGRIKARLLCRGAAELAVLCSLHASGEELEPIVFRVAEEEAFRALLERGRERAQLLSGNDTQLRRAVRALALRPLDVPPADCPALTKASAKARRAERSGPLAFGALVEALFREATAELAPRLTAHRRSVDAIVRQAVPLLEAATVGGKLGPLPRDLARRRQIALRAMRAARPGGAADDGAAMKTTEAIVTHFDALPPNAESFAAIHEREETLLALAELGHHDIAPALLARALTGDAGAVDMLGALGDRSLVPLVVPEGVPGALQPGLLRGEPSRVRLYEASVVRMVVAVGAKLSVSSARPALRALLAESPMTNWREGLERGALVRELVIALGKLEDEASAPILLAILESTSQEYRSVLPYAAQALGRLRHVPAFAGLERLLLSPKDAISCEALWAVGAIGQAHPSARERAATLLERLKGLEPGADATRLAALAKLRSGPAAPQSADLRRAIDRALWEPAYRQEDTSRRRAWGLCALEELAGLALGRTRSLSDARARSDPGTSLEPSAFFLGHEAIRHLVTRDDHRVRRAAETAFSAWALPVPKVRRYYAFAIPAVEQQGGVEGLIAAVRDPLGVFRHNVATRLAALGDLRAVRPLAEATARLFAESPTSTYEYDDAPPHLVAFVRALARLNEPEGNDVLIEGLRSDNHQVRAVVAENAPDDERFVPELTAMLGDPRSFLRSRAEKSLTSLGALTPPSLDSATNEIARVRRIEG